MSSIENEVRRINSCFTGRYQKIPLHYGLRTTPWVLGMNVDTKMATVVGGFLQRLYGLLNLKTTISLRFSSILHFHKMHFVFQMYFLNKHNVDLFWRKNTKCKEISWVKINLQNYILQTYVFLDTRKFISCHLLWVVVFSEAKFKLHRPHSLLWHTVR